MNRASHVVAVWMLGVALLICAQPARAAEKVVTPIDEITTEYKGKFATVQGKVAGERAFKSGMRYTVQDETGKITLVLFDREMRQVPKRAQLGEGATVNVTGKIDFFNEEAQIVPIRGTDVIVIAPAPVISPMAIGKISAADKDKLIQVGGVVAEASNFSAGFKLKLNDGTGQIAVTLFENVFDSLAKPADVNVGATLTVTGRVEEFNGELEVIPSSGRSVVVSAPPKREVKTYKLGAITGNDHNAVVQIEGQVAAIDRFENGLDVLVKDDSGAQMARLWNVVAERTTLKVGDAVRVVGRVRAAKNKGITIDVAMPSDIAVLAKK